MNGIVMGSSLAQRPTPVSPPTVNHFAPNGQPTNPVDRRSSPGSMPNRSLNRSLKRDWDW